MKKDRNCGCGGVMPTYPMANQMPFYQAMPQMNQIPQMQIPQMQMPQMNQNFMQSGTLEQQINNLNSQINNLERRVSSLENVMGNNYNNTNFQMM